MSKELTNEQLQALLQSPDLAEKLASLGGDAVQAFTKAATEAVQVQKEKQEAERKQKIEDLIDSIERDLEEESISKEEFALAIAARFKVSVAARTRSTKSSNNKERKNAPTRPQYRIVLDGEEHVWSGKGRSPEAFKAAKENGELDNYKMSEEEVREYMEAHPEKYGL
ncbi:TPA: H-NS family nucleoid-associated regulatory protein [Vibrio parahaemolyticus]|uniref:H-NS family nucleoid-associated regulatory protein n=1 Tax=Gammaproteobacteria TaxID=1236 RepID=UPI00111DEBF6|nr:MULTISPECIES: H-NS family nucleoid-associated regulatory protein [Vibrio harveyi group]HDY7620493.1 H-NS histone family protein [Vibrio vulnificus]EGQ8116732.1 H-NS histone family protein [Vibrio parahaemolyticus]MBE3942753.1 H-NS histone family protein [Vibrio parahaemolyticus]MBO0158703.1 H-NS histone family protein [Vibrio parahaemolyticus]MBO0173487.1 H-NS histone family protein [Vibrio parahaemolyticus]